MTLGDLDRSTEYLRFVEEPNDGKKTRRWRVESKSSGDVLGRIGWWGAWRQFVFAPHVDTVFNKGCLVDITAFLEDALAAWRYEKDLHREWNRTGGSNDVDIDVERILEIARANADPADPYDEGSVLAEALQPWKIELRDENDQPVFLLMRDPIKDQGGYY